MAQVFNSAVALSLAVPLGLFVLWLHMRKQITPEKRNFFPAFLLPQAPESLRASRQLRNKPLLLMRLLLVLLLALGMAAPSLESTSEVGLSSVVLIDTSLSMSRLNDEGTSYFEQAVERAEQLALRGAEVLYCGDKLLTKAKQTIDGAMRIEDCLHTIQERSDSAVWVLTDGFGAERMPAAQSNLHFEQIGKAPAEKDVLLQDRALKYSVVVERSSDGQQRLVNNTFSRLSIQQIANDGNSTGPQVGCPQNSACQLAQKEGWVNVQLPPSGQEGQLQLDRVLEWRIPQMDPYRTINIVSSAAGSGLYSGHHLLTETFESFARTHEQFGVKYIHQPEQLANVQGVVVVHWDSWAMSAWAKALQKLPASVPIWVIPSGKLPDTLEPRALTWAIGTYRGYLQRHSEIDFASLTLPGQKGTQEVSFVAQPVRVRKAVSLAETGSAEIVLRDIEGNPVVMWNEKPRPVLFFLTGWDPQFSDIALSPNFIPMIAVFMQHFNVRETENPVCTAALLRGNGLVCPGFASEVAKQNKSAEPLFVQPNWHELAPRIWLQSDSAPVASATIRIPQGARIAFGGLLLLLLPALWHAFSRVGTTGMKQNVRQKLMLLILLNMAIPVLWGQGAEAIAAEKAKAEAVGLLEQLQPDSGRLRAFQALSGQLDKRSNILLETPTLQVKNSTLKKPQQEPSFYWSNLCRKSLHDLQQGLSQGVEKLHRGAVWWIEDCASPGETTPGYELLVQMLRDRGIGANLEALRSDHVLFKTYYLLNRLQGRFAAGGEKVLESGGMPMVLYTPQDITGKASYGIINEKLIRSFVNIQFYLFMGDYKKDGIHVPYLLKRLKRAKR